MKATADLVLRGLLTDYEVNTREVMIQVEREQQTLTVSTPRQQVNSALLWMADI